MATIKVLKKNSKVDGEKIIVTKTTEEHLSLEDLQREKLNVQRQRENITKQFKQLKAQYTAWNDKEKEIDALIEQLPKQDLGNL